MLSYVGLALVVSLSSFLIHYYSIIEQYMDEIFHIPQAMQYCEGNFHDWDSNITTYPGLYLTSYVVLKTLNAILLGFYHISCSTSFLRSINILLSCSLPSIYYYCRLKITSNITTKHTEDDAYFISCLLYLYPLSMFYYPLYYTDTISIVSISITYLVSLHHNTTCLYHNKVVIANLFSSTQHLLLLVLASWSILARQTNAVWTLFIIGTLMLRLYLQLENKSCDDDNDNDDELKTISKQLLGFLSFLWKYKGFLIVQTWSLLLPVIFFVFYVVYTGSIVVGHQSHHIPTLHLAMLTHALFLCTLIQLPLVLRNITQYILSTTIIDKSNDKNSSATSKTVAVFIYERLVQIPLLHWMLYLSIVIISYVALVYYSFSHPFLESDNRHYMFYVWRRFLKHKSFRMIISPIYCSMVTATIIRLRSINGLLWILIYLLALAISLVPTPLLEPRYFTPGIVFFTLHSPIISNKPIESSYGSHSSNSNSSSDNSSNSPHMLMVYVNILIFIIINAITMYVFINKAFTSSDGQIARFMY